MWPPPWIRRKWKTASKAPIRASVSGPQSPQPSCAGSCGGRFFDFFGFLRFISKPERDFLRRDRAGARQAVKRCARRVQVALALVGGGADLGQELLDARRVEPAGPRHLRDPRAHLDGGVDAVGRGEKALDESAHAPLLSALILAISSA